MKTIDVYGSPFNFTIFSQPIYKTAIGGFATIVTLFLYIFCFLQFGKDFWMQQNPRFLNQRITLPSYPKYVLNRDDLLIGFRVEDIDGNYVDISRLLNISIVFYKYKQIEGSLVSKISTIKLVDCSLINRQAMKMFTKRNLSNIMCLDFNNITLGGYWDGEFLNYVMINFNACVNSTENNKTCMDYNEALNFFSKGMPSFNIYTGSSFTDLEDHDNPLKMKLFNQYNYIDPYNGKNLRLFYKSIYMTTDLGMITSMPNKYKLFGLDYFVTDIIPVNPPLIRATKDTKLFTIEVYFLDNIETFVVTYIKLQETLATLGGLLNFISLIFRFFIGYINEHYRNIEIINNLFDFSEINEEEKLEKVIQERKQNKHDNYNENKIEKEYEKNVFFSNQNQPTTRRPLKNHKFEPDTDDISPYAQKISYNFRNNKDLSNNLSNMIKKSEINQNYCYDESDKRRMSTMKSNVHKRKLTDFEEVSFNNDVSSTIKKNDISQIAFNDETSEKRRMSTMKTNINKRKLTDFEDVSFNNDISSTYKRSETSQIAYYDETSEKRRIPTVKSIMFKRKISEIEQVLFSKDVSITRPKNDLSLIYCNDFHSEKRQTTIFIPKPDGTKLKEVENVTLNGLKDWIQNFEKSIVNFDIGLCLMLKSIICPKSLSSKESFYMKLYNRSLEIINNKMDMINYLKFVHEYIHVKCFLFEDLQSLCLGFIKKPKIFEKSRFVTINSKSHKQLKQIIQFFKEKKELSKKDLKIYELLSDEIKLMIYKFRDNK